MKILIDLTHPSHLNVFKNAIKILSQQGHHVTVLVLKRGTLPEIAKKELSGINIITIGKRSESLFSIVFNGNLLRFIKIFFFVLNHKAQLGLSIGGFLLGAALKIFGIPNLQFDDDVERKWEMLLEKLTCSRLYLPPIVKPREKTHFFNGPLEWAHLSPKYFSPREKALKDYNLKPKNYIFIREIKTNTINYRHQKPDIIADFAQAIPENLTVVLSLEDKSKKKYYPRHWIILEEPVNDIHSLMYFSKLVISSGDSMAREGALLGVPSIYCGFRQMAINKFVEEKSMFYHLNPQQVTEFLGHVMAGVVTLLDQDILRQKLFQEWEDVTELIVNESQKYKNSSAKK